VVSLAANGHLFGLNNMTDETYREHVFKEDEHVLFVDRRGRKYLVKLKASARFDSHIGAIQHDDVIGLPEGSWITTARGHILLAVKPSMVDFVLNMPRIATVVYPKDLGAILVYGDIFPGARVLEAGAGSGALTTALLRAVGSSGSVVSYDVRQDMIDRATENVSAIVSDHSNLSIKLGDVYEGIEERELDRIVLDLPEPWQVVPHASTSLVPGGIFLSFLPTVLQVHELSQALRTQKTFEMIETMEIMMRPWSVANRSVRPEHRMVAHTGFITTARKCAPRPVSANKASESPENGETNGETQEE
jgi:tRNA (adenine57-N1/adenine58-N1)-methyltransferase